MADRSQKDTRQHRRMTLRVMVDFISDAGVACDYATTLGAGGIFLETEHALQRGDTLKLRFRLPDGEDLHEIQGRVVWVRKRGGGVGIKFTDPESVSRLARELENFEL